MLPEESPVSDDEEVNEEDEESGHTDDEELDEINHSVLSRETLMDVSRLLTTMRTMSRSLG
jgi:hypothetical protein